MAALAMVVTSVASVAHAQSMQLDPAGSSPILAAIVAGIQSVSSGVG